MEWGISTYGTLVVLEPRIGGLLVHELESILAAGSNAVPQEAHHVVVLSLADGDIAVEISAVLDMLSGSMLAVSVSAGGIWARDED